MYRKYEQHRELFIYVSTCCFAMHIDLLKDWPYTFQGQIVYGVVGSFNAPFYFGLDNSSGEVAIINDLKTDIRQQYDVSSTVLFSLSGHALYMTVLLPY